MILGPCRARVAPSPPSLCSSPLYHLPGFTIWTLSSQIVMNQMAQIEDDSTHSVRQQESRISEFQLERERQVERKREAPLTLWDHRGPRMAVGRRGPAV